MLRFENKDYSIEPGESVLDCLLRQGEPVSSLCRSGACQSCLLQATSGPVPAVAQQGLKDAWKQQGYFLACVCRPQADLTIERCDAAASYESVVRSVTQLAPNVIGVRLARPSGFEFRAGQFIQLSRPSDGLMRPYSIASMPTDGELELHVALLPSGQMSGWLRDAIGQSVSVRGPFGECFYQEGEPDRPLVLAGTGTGLAPLMGVLRTAARNGHRGEISLFHGSPQLSGIYLRSELEALTDTMPNLRLFASLLSGPEAELGEQSRWQLEVAPLDQVVFSRLPKLDAHRLFVCGQPALVHSLRKRAYLAGAPLNRIHCDAFAAPHSAS
ncbi:MAG TPA: 2Fe-2S iron-sulfur cluster binding domain-containing protein [Polyangiaceae bacterium]|nr:2Fe-2S iron-sulfur cluster binding domain-containing protein [Polyangiaceae bacterium]